MIPPLMLSAGGGGPSRAENSGMFDSSGWNVSFGSGDISSSAGAKATPYSVAGAAVAAAGEDWTPFIIGLGVLVIWKMTRKK